MSKFGDLIQEPVLLCFHNGSLDTSRDIRRNLAASLDIKVIAIDITKNEELCNALKVKSETYLVYKNSKQIKQFSKDTKPQSIINYCNLITYEKFN